ncbi:MAG: Crp/Fnr family transcriptional regulator [Bacteroidia bacterium]|nr:Crp/Fnr family transcriptional regulator [Bacteroidia bacterium]MDW8348477.1 Crp/Fnr family transcriptional regulator [Bacteroidia bacterium]
MALSSVFEAELLKKIESVSTRKLYKADTVILDVHQPIKSIPIVISGTIKVFSVDESGRELLLYYVYPNESCAMTFTCCMQQRNSEIRAVIEEDAELLLLPISVMDEWIVKYPTWKSFVTQTMYNRFNELLKSIHLIAFERLDERLIRYLIEKSKLVSSTVLDVSHQQIADELATSRVVISRLLKKLENDNKVILYRNQIKLLKGIFVQSK